MKNTFLVLIQFVLLNSLIAQDNTSYSAMILSLNGEGTILRNSKVLPLELPQRYLPGDILTVKHGNAIVMLFSGLEIPLSAVSNYTVPLDKNSESSELFAMANNVNETQSLLSQSGKAYRIRGESNVFPTKTKVLNTENIILRLDFENLEELNLGLKVIDSQTQKILFEQTAIRDSIISLAEVPFIDGKSYYWTLANTPTGKPEMGTLVISKSEDIKKMVELKDLRNHYDNLNAISAYFNDSYFSDAYALILKCIEEYPDFEIYKVMLKNVLAE